MKFKQLVFSSIFWRGVYFATVLLLNIIVARYFEANGSGWIYYITNYFSFILLVASLNLETGMTFYSSGGSMTANKLAMFSLLWSIVIPLLIAGFFLLTYQQSGALLSRGRFAFFALIYSCGVLLTTFFCALFYAKRNFRLPNSLLAITNFVLIVGVAAGFYSGKAASVKALFLEMYFLTFLLQGIVLFTAYAVKYKIFYLPGLPSLSDCKKLLRYSSLALFTNIVFFLLYRVDYWFIKNLCMTCSQGDLGNYIQVAKLGQLFLLLPSFIASAVFPHTAAGNRAEVNRWLPLLVKAMLVFDAVVLIILAVTGKWLFPGVFGASFNRMYIPFLILIPGILALSAISVLSAYNAGKDRVATNMKGALSGLVFIIAGNWLFIPRYGIQAAAAVSSGGYLIYLAYLMYRFKKEYHTSLYLFFWPDRRDMQQLRELLSYRRN